MKYMSVTLAGSAPNDGERLVQLSGIVKSVVGGTSIALTYDDGSTATLAYSTASAANQKIIVDEVVRIQKQAINEGPDSAGIIAYSAAQPAAGFTAIT